ncbi:hypothetical protein, partial [Streptomyces sp. M10]|uniref:hypothetical protein n=1 Tax=Streptomyces sp. M10 TaxID=412968 RepID=UPI001955346D
RRIPLTGNQARKDLIESEPPEREKRSGNAELEPVKAPRRSDAKESDRVGDTKYRREAPGGKPERVSTKEASVP